MESFAERIAECTDSISLTNGCFNRPNYEEWKKRCDEYAEWKDPVLVDRKGINERGLIRVLSTIMFRRLASNACGLEEQYLTSGKYPAEFAGQGENGVDIGSGERVNYQCSDDGRSYRLYSIGWDQNDDGGTPGKLEPPWTGDWVWSLPGFQSPK